MRLEEEDTSIGGAKYVREILPMRFKSRISYFKSMYIVPFSERAVLKSYSGYVFSAECRLPCVCTPISSRVHICK